MLLPQEMFKTIKRHESRGDRALAFIDDLLGLFFVIGLISGIGAGFCIAVLFAGVEL